MNINLVRLRTGVINMESKHDIDLTESDDGDAIICFGTIE